jgi:hypothetical protein
MTASRRLAIEPLPAMIPLDDQKRIIELYQKGGSMMSVAKATYYGQTTVRNVLIRNGVQPRPRGAYRPWSPSHISTEEKLKRCQLYGRGLSIDEVAEACGVTKHAIQETLRSEGVKMRPQGPNLRWQRKG